MSLYQKLQQRAEKNKPILVGMIGIGKFGSMYLAQVPNTPGVEVVGVADLSPSQAKSNLLQVGWEGERLSVHSLDDAISLGRTYLTDDWEAPVSYTHLRAHET